MSSTVVLGQNVPKAERSLTDSGGDSQPLFSETAVDQSPDAGCCDSGCRPSCCPPRWTVSADFIILDRVGSFHQTLVELVPYYEDPFKNTGPEALNADDLHQGFAGGPRIGLIRHGDDGHDLEVSYFQIDGWNVSRSIGPVIEPDGHVDYLVMRAPGGFVQFQEDPGQRMEWDYASRLYNAEVNVRWNRGRRVTLLAGFRWVNLSEDLEGILLPPTPHGTGSFWYAQTKNNLYGLQLGMDVKLLERNRFSIGGVLKAGLFDDHVEETATVRMERIQFGESASTNHLAFLGEVGVRCTYRVTPRLSLKAGYEAIWLQGVALAPGQISETYCYYTALPQDIYVQSLGINCRSGVFYHGATVGLEYAF
jgi:hypothetical protein